MPSSRTWIIFMATCLNVRCSMCRRPRTSTASLQSCIRSTRKALRQRIADGFQFIAVASEAGFMLTKAQEVLHALGIRAEEPVAKY